MSTDTEGDARSEFEAFHAARKSKGVAHRNGLFERWPDGSYSNESVQRHWWTWQSARRPPTMGSEGDARDAARYRFLRDSILDTEEPIDGRLFEAIHANPSAMDSALDAALAATKGATE